MNSLGIAIDGGRYIRVDSRIGELPRHVRLRALNADQRSAVIGFCRFRHERPEVIRNHRIGNLDAASDTPAEFRLRIERRSFAMWEARISAPGGLVETVRLRTRKRLWPLIFPAAALAGILAWLLIRPPGFLSGTGRQPIPTPEPVTAGSPGAETQDMQPPDPGAGPPVIETEPPPPADTSPDPDASPAVGFPEPLTVYFQPESAVLSTRAREDLASLAGYIGAGTVLLIEGHSAEFGTEPGQRALSVLRARNVADFIESIGSVPAVIDTEGYGTDRPATLDVDRQELNRRVVVTFRESAE